MRKLKEREAQDALRRLRLPDGKVDLCSNDYLGVVRNGLLEDGILVAESLAEQADRHGSGGSRLLAGNYPLIEETERQIAEFHGAPAALIYNSGYDANVGLLSSVPQRGDVILYDSLSHASIRDGIRLSVAQSYKFAHNDVEDLQRKLKRFSKVGNVFVVTESIFSMDGDIGSLNAISFLCYDHGAKLIVDEAHATGAVGIDGKGVVQLEEIEDLCFARIYTFGKALGCHGAVVVGSHLLREYLINFSRSFIYTTALPPVSIRAIARAYTLLPKLGTERKRLRMLISRFMDADIAYERSGSVAAIQPVIVPGNTAVKALAKQLQAAGLDVRPILSPTVEKGRERLRIVLHAFNTEEEIDRLASLLGA